MQTERLFTIRIAYEIINLNRFRILESNMTTIQRQINEIVSRYRYEFIKEGINFGLEKQSYIDFVRLLPHSIVTKHIECTRILLENGADPNISVSEHMTMPSLAFAIISKRDFAMIKLLVSHGGRLDFDPAHTQKATAVVLNKLVQRKDDALYFLVDTGVLQVQPDKIIMVSDSSMHWHMPMHYAAAYFGCPSAACFFREGKANNFVSFSTSEPRVEVTPCTAEPLGEKILVCPSILSASMYGASPDPAGVFEYEGVSAPSNWETRRPLWVLILSYYSSLPPKPPPRDESAASLSFSLESFQRLSTLQNKEQILNLMGEVVQEIQSFRYILRIIMSPKGCLYQKLNDLTICHILQLAFPDKIVNLNSLDQFKNKTVSTASQETTEWMWENMHVPRPPRRAVALH